MTTRTCSIADCERPHIARGWCGMHYGRWYRNGDPLIDNTRRHVTAHGTYNEYQNFGCRCPACREAAVIYQREKHRIPCRRCGAPVWGRYQTPRTGLCMSCVGLRRRVAEHGTVGAYKRGCRCEICRGHQAELRRRYRRTHPEAARRENKAARLKRARQRVAA